MTAEPNWRGVKRNGVLADVAPHEPLTRQRCADLAAGQGINTPLYSSTDDQIANALWRMFGGAAVNAPLIGREVVDAYAERWSAPELEAYWRDPAPFEVERAQRRAIYDAALAPHRARVRAAQEARWAAEEAESQS